MSKSFDLARRSHDSGDDTKQKVLLSALAEAQRRFESVNEDIVRKAAEVAKRAAEVTDAVSRGIHVNNLGAIQSAGPDLDRLCAVRQERTERLAELVHVCRAVGIDVSDEEVFA